MIATIKNWFHVNRTLIILSFETFWIVVFLLEQLSNESSVNIPQFVYVNF